MDNEHETKKAIEKLVKWTKMWKTLENKLQNKKRAKADSSIYSLYQLECAN